MILDMSTLAKQGSKAGKINLISLSFGAKILVSQGTWLMYKSIIELIVQDSLSNWSGNVYKLSMCVCSTHIIQICMLNMLLHPYAWLIREVWNKNWIRVTLSSNLHSQCFHIYVHVCVCVSGIHMYPVYYIT